MGRVASVAPRPTGGRRRNLSVMNDESANVSKIRTADMTVVQRVATTTHPIGIACDDETRELCVRCYGGKIFIFRD